MFEQVDLRDAFDNVEYEYLANTMLLHSTTAAQGFGCRSFFTVNEV